MITQQTTAEYVKFCVEATVTPRFDANGLLGEIIIAQTAKLLEGQPSGHNLIPFGTTAWIADNIHEAICKFVEAVEREAETNMLKTGQLEGAHYAAMKRLIKQKQAFARGWTAAIEAALLKLPGGQSCDPQAVADEIRTLTRNVPAT